VHSFTTLLRDLASRARVTYAVTVRRRQPFQQVPEPTPLQARAYELLSLLPATGK
jgi:hypothetical protein